MLSIDYCCLVILGWSLCQNSMKGEKRKLVIIQQWPLTSLLSCAKTCFITFSTSFSLRIQFLSIWSFLINATASVVTIYFWILPPDLRQIPYLLLAFQSGLQTWGQFDCEASSSKYCTISRCCHWKEALNVNYRVLERGEWKCYLSSLEVYLSEFGKWYTLDFQGDLHQHLKEKGALNPSTAINFALDIAR